MYTQYTDQNVAVELTGYECMNVLTRTVSNSIPSETSTTSADEATEGVGTVSILVTVVSAQVTLIDICRNIVDMCYTQYMDQNVAVELTGYECMNVLTITDNSIPIETSTTSADEATGGVGTVSILVTVV